jgi:hypothetical protein
MARMTTARKLLLGLLGGGGFSPLSISGLALWLDASDASTLFQAHTGTTPAVADGDVVGYWGDKSGNGKNAIQSVAGSKPVLKLAQKNGRNTVRHDTTDDVLTASSLSLSQPNCVWMVAKIGAGSYWYSGGSGASKQVSYSPFLFMDAGTSINAGAGLANTWRLLTHVWNTTSSVLRAEGAQLAAGAVGSGVLTDLRLNVSAFDTGYGGAEFGEIIVANGLPSAATITAVENYLNTKWTVY